MIYRIFFFLVFSGVLFHSCQNKPDANAERVELIGKVYAAHDSVMLDTDNYILPYIFQFEEKKAALEMDSLNDHSEKLKQIDVVLKELKLAEEGMFDWMNQFKMPPKDDERPHGEVMEYLNNQLQIMKEVEVQTDKSKEMAKKLMDQIK